MNSGLTPSEAGLTLDEQFTLVLQAIESSGGAANIQAVYDAVANAIEQRKPGFSLSEQGKASLRRVVNTNAVKVGYVYPHDPSDPGWRITSEGREYLQSQLEAPVTELVIDVDTRTAREVPTNTVRGAMFEKHVGRMLKHMYPAHAWISTGIYKRNERGLDFYGSLLSGSSNQPSSIGVQVKLHQPNNAPSEIEWLKFLSGCFARRVDQALFITSGRLTAEQYREAVEAKVIVISSMDEINRHGARYGMDAFVDPALEPDS